MSEAFRTLTRETSHEIPKIKGSRFIASAAPFEDEAGLKRLIERLRDDFPDACHHCWAWRHGDDFRYSDDGEPSGTAGRPILQQIDGHRLDRVCVVITRIFGGTKLGAGGLVRAYSAAAGAVLDEAPVEQVIPTRRVRVRLPYALEGTLRSVATEAGVQPVESDYGEQIEQSFDVPVGQLPAFLELLRERSAGRAEIETDEA